MSVLGDIFIIPPAPPATKRGRDLGFQLSVWFSPFKVAAPPGNPPCKQPPRTLPLVLAI
jgi:hypothetical protein